MLVHSCFAESLDGQRTPITDERGCSLDEDLLPNLSYGNDLKLAYAKADVFKYPDHSYIQFRCQIRLCPTSEECLKIMPPQCSQNRRQKRMAAGGPIFDVDLFNSIKNDMQRYSMDVISDALLVVDDA
uniref:ZP domain-containing protein n=2 Tax=Romanomermis culicivorax TaxID=13658 RepID=A0A915KT43_ROMCU